MGVMHFDFMSDKLGYQTNIYVILPSCMERGEAPKGILYLLHGGAGNGLDWMRNTSIERYAQPYDLGIFHHCGINPEEKDILVVKSAVHFRAHYITVAQQIFDVETPALGCMQPQQLPLTHCRRPIYPLDDLI